ncbi:MAG: sugar ABC transporter ATP-binding protein [Fimbriimonadaceae bacterium]|nr:sugar ABC transporter ATP-binding protein [Fimbriimonadaceae bacterium]
MTVPLLEVRNVAKSFPGVQALGGVSLRLEAGEVLGLVGENGAGKSTLLKILGGVERPDSGEVLLDGRACAIRSVQDATRLGIALIHQELNLSDNLSVAENVFLGREPHRLGMVDRARMDRETAHHLRELAVEMGPRDSVERLSIGQCQLVEVAKALSIEARIVIMDEPTSSLSLSETDKLFAVIRRLRDRGVGVLYVSHRLGEVTEVADRVVVLRDGLKTGELAKEAIAPETMIRLMVGRDIPARTRKPSPVRERAETPPVLELKDLRVFGRAPVNLAVYPGEIVGLAGLVGAGRSTLTRALFGLLPYEGEIRVAGRLVRLRNPAQAMAAGLALVPEDRKQDGLVLDLSVAENIALPNLSSLLNGPFLNWATLRRLAELWRGKLGIKTTDVGKFAEGLSGGNQQKVVFAKWLARDPKVLILDEPTRGVDVGAKEEIYELVRGLTEQGMGALMVSSDMHEILTVPDRIVVMHEGAIRGEVSPTDATEEGIMRLATGGAR